MATLERSARVWLFHLKHLRGEKGQISFNISREVCKYLADSHLVQVTKTCLRYFDFRTSTWGPQVPLNTQIQADRFGSRWMVLEERVFCCGGGFPGIATAYILARDGVVEQKASMSEGRRDHGLLAIHNAAYVFGGGGNCTIISFNTCEKWVEDKWRNLPSMREGRSGFNPCMLWGRVYLCGYPSQIVEAFVPQTDTFLPLLVTLPEKSNCCLYVDSHLLVVHSQTYVLKFAVQPDGQLTKRSEVKSPQIDTWQNSQPVVDKAKGVVYIIREGYHVSFHMETGVRVALG